ncbi:hypothetical protein ACIGXX_43300 [Streptomyces sp. NPDC055243]|uniref:hypothetical protein n=1 Tax=Streptomyces sp. NPDC055243 TaxID=3365720 RepID=UPI0037CF0E82
MEYSSGNRQHRRLNRGGNRQANGCHCPQQYDGNGIRALRRYGVRRGRRAGPEPVDNGVPH